MTEQEAMAREIAADKRQQRTKRDYSSECPECDTTVWIYDASQDERETFLDGWDAAMEYVSSVSRLSPEHSTMRALLEYPNPVGLHPNEARWRDFARALINVPHR